MFLLTGANGLIGSFLLKKLLENGHEVRAIKRPGSDLSLVEAVADRVQWIEGDILDVHSLEEAVQGVNTVIHAAALVSYASGDKERIFKVNVEGTRNVVNAALEAGAEKLCHVSSVSALGKKKGQTVVNENIPYESSQLSTTYGQSKFLAELEVYRGFEEGLKGFMVNPTLVLGPGDWNKSSTHMFKYVYDEKPFFSKGLANYVDVRDVADIICQLLGMPEDKVNKEKFILNAGTVTFQTLFEVMADCFGKKKPHIHANKTLTEIAWRLEYLRSLVTGTSPLITKETSRLSRGGYRYSNDKVRELLGYQFRNLQDTISWTCGELLKSNERVSKKIA